MAILDSLTNFFTTLVSMIPTASASSVPSEPSPLPWTGEPTILDVQTVKDILASLKTHPLPTELIDIIIDQAEYWPHTTSFPHPNCSVRQDGNILVTRSMPLGYPDASGPITYPLTPEDYASGGPRFDSPWPYMLDNQTRSSPRILDTWKASSMPDTQLTHPCRKISISIRSHDQGWGGQHHHKGTYEGSFTWFDLGLQRLHGIDMSQLPDDVLGERRTRPSSDDDGYTSESTDEGESYPAAKSSAFYNRGTPTSALPGWDTYSFDLEQIDPPFSPPQSSQEVRDWQGPEALSHPFLPTAKTLQRNRTATSAFADHEITLRYDDAVNPDSEFATKVLEKEMGRGREILDGELVRNLQVGDVVTVWARARFPGWTNVVERVEVKVYWAV